MTSNWVYLWVQIMAHHKLKLGLLWLIITLFSLSGLVFGQAESLIDYFVTGHSREFLSGSFALKITPIEILLVIISAISAFIAWQSESIKSGVLLFGILTLLTTMVLGVSSWIGLSFRVFEFFALMISLTLVTANYVHLISTLHREMARGLFQFDAIAEAIKLNHTPILLSNLTTALSLIFLAYNHPSLINVAMVLSIGVLLSYLFALSLFPWILLNWLLEFRVGNRADRKGLYAWVEILKNWSRLKWMTIFMMTFYLATYGFLFGWAWKFSSMPAEIFEQMLAFALVLGLLFLLWWKKLFWSLLLVFIMTWVAMASLFIVDILKTGGWFESNFTGRQILQNETSNYDYWLLLLVAPIGIVVDDLIHFFARLYRAQFSVFGQGRQAVTFAMMSVGRPILITSITLMMATFLLFLVGNTFFTEILLMLLISIILITLKVLLSISLLLLCTAKKD